LENNSIVFAKNKNLDFFPRMRAMSLDSSMNQEEETEINELKKKLDSALSVINKLDTKLEELKYLVLKIYLFSLVNIFQMINSFLF
jgi:hypothetical protein